MRQCLRIFNLIVCSFRLITLCSVGSPWHELYNEFVKLGLRSQKNRVKYKFHLPITINDLNLKQLTPRIYLKIKLYKYFKIALQIHIIVVRNQNNG